MKKTILCIDDIQTNLFTLTSVIDSLAEEQYEVLTAQSANEGLSILLKHHVDIILLDVMMPEIDGFEAAKMIRSNKKTKNIPIIFVTANKDDKTIEECYRVGGDDYVNKPFNHVELLARISFHLKLKENEKLLQQEKDYAQSVINLQENLILVTDGKLASNVNSALLNLYGISSLKEFQDEHKCICNSFVVEDGYFSLESVKQDDIWVDEVIRLSVLEDVLVKIIRDESEYIFNINATLFLNQYIITLTDITQMSQQSLEYKHEASFDALTQIYNRNMFHRLINRKISLSKVQKKSFIFIILDIDNFKKVNDEHGHLVGDQILKDISKLIKKHIRESDIFARWGGEEFVLAFDVSRDRGLQIAQSLRKHIEEESFDVVNLVTCSFGLTEFKGSDTLDSMIKRADSALYSAKNSGRNQVCLA